MRKQTQGSESEKMAGKNNIRINLFTRKKKVNLEMKLLHKNKQKKIHEIPVSMSNH